MDNNMLLKRGAQLLLIVAVFFLGWYAGQTNGSPAAPSPAPASSETAAETVTLMIDYGNGTVVSIPDVMLPEGATMYDALKTATESKDIVLVSKDYGGELGQFIQSIDGKQGSGDEYWQYWVNGMYSQQGVSSVKATPGDVIEFKLTKGQQGQ